MDYPWYEEISNSDEIMQGDIVRDCPIPIPSEGLFKSILKDDGKIESEVDLKQADVIILSQACDITHNSIDSIVVCPVWTLKKLKKENKHYSSSEARESLRQGRQPSYHLLDQYSSDIIKQEFSVVDFHRLYSLPKAYLKNVAKNIDNRLRLLPPYREHLSQAFARYFMRVGLPMDIDKEAVKAI